MFDPRIEPPLTLTEACKLQWLRTRRGRPNRKTLDRWASTGKNGTRLECVRMGGARFTSEAALVRFFEAAENASNAGPSVAAVGVQRTRDVAQAAAALSAAGI